MKVEIIGRGETDDLLIATVSIEKAQLKIDRFVDVVRNDDIMDEEIEDMIKKNLKAKKS